VRLNAPPDYFMGTVSVEVRREPANDWKRIRSWLAQLVTRAQLGLAPVIERGSDYAGYILLFEDEVARRPIFAEPGVYHLRACVPSRGPGELMSQSVRVEVAETPDAERRLIAENAEVIRRALNADFDGDPEAIGKIESRIGDCALKAALQDYLAMLALLRDSEFVVNQDFKRLISRLRDKRGPIHPEFYALSGAEHFVRKRKWAAAKELLSLVPERNCKRDMLSEVVQIELEAEEWRAKQRKEPRE
jgi:hypothetical protein